MQLVALVMAAALSIPTVSTAQDRQVTGYPELPADARRVVERSAACRHLADEIAGNGSERDRRVNLQIRKLRWDSLEQEATRMGQKYKGRPEVIRLVDASMAWLEPEPLVP